MRCVIVETPYAGAVRANVKYARACVADCLKRGEAPFASHLLYTQLGILDDLVPEQRKRGIKAGLAWGSRADATVVYVDRGISPGMQEGIDRARAERRLVEFRALRRYSSFGPTCDPASWARRMAGIVLVPELDRPRPLMPTGPTANRLLSEWMAELGRAIDREHALAAKHHRRDTKCS